MSLINRNFIKNISDWIGNNSPVKTDRKELAMRVYDAIIATIGLENIAMFLPMWETEGDFVHDLIKPDLKFKVGTPGNLGSQGLLHEVPSFSNNANHAIVQAPLTESPEKDTPIAMDGPDKMLAQRIKRISGKVAFIRIQSNIVGSLGSARLEIAIHEDASGVPGDVVATSNDFSFLSSLNSADRMVGMRFQDEQLTLRGDTDYWLVLKYNDGTGVDGSNYINWNHDANAVYDEDSAVFDGSSWTAGSGAHTFDIYTDDFVFPEDFSVIAAVRHEFPSLGSRRVLLSSASHTGSVGLNLYWDAREYMFTNRTGGVAYDVRSSNTISQEHVVLAGSFSASLADDKYKLFMNGHLRGTENGNAGSTHARLIQPMCIGSEINSYGELSNNFTGRVGPVIITHTALTAGQMADVAHLLMLNKKLRA